MTGPLAYAFVTRLEAGNDPMICLLDLVAAGCKVKATGFGRVKLDVPATLEAIAKKNPNALVFGTDIPSTRAERPFLPSDIDLVERVLDLLQQETRAAMMQVGAPSLKHLVPTMVRRAS